MRIWMLTAGAAALAITAPALADPNKGGGKGGKAESAQVERGGGKARAAHSDHRQPKAERGQAKQGVAQVKRDERSAAKALRVEERGDRGRGKDDVRAVRADKIDRDAVRVVDNDIVIRRAFDLDPFPGRGRGLIAGCPPGLWKKDNGCRPPGQVNHLLGSAIAKTAFANSLVPFQYRNWFRDDDDHLFRAGDGFIYRVDRNDGLIDGLIPLMTGGGFPGYYALGDPWPSPYNFYNVPYQYRSMWPDNGNDCYRYDGFGAIYRVNCNTNVVNSIVSLLAGDLGVGQPLPMAYNVYNVPMAYRANYYDSPDAWYRYNDGYIYRVDPTTRLITAVIDALI